MWNMGKEKKKISFAVLVHFVYTVLVGARAHTYIYTLILYVYTCYCADICNGIYFHVYIYFSYILFTR